MTRNDKISTAVIVGVIAMIILLITLSGCSVQRVQLLSLQSSRKTDPVAYAEWAAQPPTPSPVAASVSTLAALPLDMRIAVLELLPEIFQAANEPMLEAIRYGHAYEDSWVFGLLNIEWNKGE